MNTEGSLGDIEVRQLLYAVCSLLVLGVASSSHGAETSKPGTFRPEITQAASQWIGGDLSGKRKLEEAAASGDVDAQEALGELLNGGFEGQPPDIPAGCRYFEKASTKRADALHSLAYCIEIGALGPIDLPRAAKLYREAADAGFPKAMCALGNLYLNGKGVAKDPERGASLCRKGAELGDKDAQTDLGNAYLRGEGVPHDMVQARLWYEKAAAQGQRNAEFVLGQIYWNGDGVAADQAKAVSLLTSAYQDGRKDAAPLLGAWNFVRFMAMHRLGDTSLIDQAIAWDEIALKQATTGKARNDAESALTLSRAVRAAEYKVPKTKP